MRNNEQKLSAEHSPHNKLLYFDCSSGIAGDMFSASLLDALPDSEAELLIDKLNALQLPEVEFKLEHVDVCNIKAARLKVLVRGEQEGASGLHAHSSLHTHSHEHAKTHASSHSHAYEHSHTSLSCVCDTIRSLNLPKQVTEDSIAVFELIAQAESAVHATSVSQVHFHEVGTLDAIADVVAASFILHHISPISIVASPVNVGSGTVQCAHGTLPVPAPATVELLRGIPVVGASEKNSNVTGELCTPTGAALLKHFADNFGPMPCMTIESTGLGAGSKSCEGFDVLRAFIGNSSDLNNSPATQNTSGSSQKGMPLPVSSSVVEVACNIDDMTGEELGFALDALNASDVVLDAFIVPIQMKKSRPGHMIVALCSQQHTEDVARLMFEYTTTIGVRIKQAERLVLQRTVEERLTPVGRIRVKISKGYGTIREKAEFDDLSCVAKNPNTIAEENASDDGF